MSRWFRFYDDALNDPKVQGLPPTLFKFWVNLLCVASRNDGRIPPLDELKTALKARLDHVEAHLNDLVKRGLVDVKDTHAEPHNWPKRQYKSDISTERVKRHRNVSKAVPETPPETDTETEKKKDAPKQAPLFPVVPRETTDEAEMFARGKKVLGADAGGLIVRLLKSKKGNVALARAAIEQASTKSDAREYIGRIIAGPAAANERHGMNDPLAGIQ